MKKNILKIIASVVSIVFLVLWLWLGIDNIISIMRAIKRMGLTGDFAFDFKWIMQIVREFVMLIVAVLLFLVVNLKDLQFLTESILEKTKKYREKKKKEKLETDIAKKQAMLEEMKKDGE
jgi:hypothetical protein